MPGFFLLDPLPNNLYLALNTKSLPAPSFWPTLALGRLQEIGNMPWVRRLTSNRMR